MLKKMTCMLVIVILLALAACQEEDGEALVVPTQFDLAMAQTSDAATAIYEATLYAPTPVPTSVRPTLPPTYTLVSTPTEMTPTVLPETAPESDDTSGSIYFVYNNDSIIAVSGDGLRAEFIYTVGMGIPIEHLTPSPDGEFLAFVAPGSGSAREVWIIRACISSSIGFCPAHAIDRLVINNDIRILYMSFTP